jgi:hypothetical protein
VDDSWEEIVEVSFRPTREKVHLLGLDDDTPHRLRLPPGDYRVRYSVRGIDEADHSEEAPDAYLLQFWPGTPAADRILRRTSPRAAYWHRAHRSRPLPPAEQDAEDHSVAGEEQGHLLEKYGVIPNARLQAADAYTTGLTLIDRELVLALSEADDEVLGPVARWAALRALAVAGLTDHHALVPAVTALQTGEPLPAPFDDEHGWYSVLDDVGARTYVPRLPIFDDEPGRQEDQQLYALSGLGSFAIEDPLAAAVSVVESAAITFGPDGYPQFLADLRTTFPQCA